MPKETKTQADQRRSFNVADQHGRIWLLSIEKETGDPTGSIQPCFDAPIIPPQKYLKLTGELDRRLEIDYDHWIRDLQNAHRDYVARLHEAGRLLYGDAYNAERAAKPAQLQMVGEPPLEVATIEALAAGDVKLLGLEEE